MKTFLPWCSRRALLRACLALVVIAVGAGCRTVDPARHAEALQKWEKELAAFASADREAPPQPGGTLFVGSSSFRLWRNMAEAFPGRTVINRGFGGSQMHELLALSDELVWPYAPAEVLIYEGDNDTGSGKSPGQFFSEFKDFVREVHRRLPDARVYFVAIKPSPRREQLLPQAMAANKLVEDYARNRSWLTYIDIVTPMLDASGKPRGELFVEDRLHLNAAGYAIWAEVIGEALRGADEL